MVFLTDQYDEVFLEDVSTLIAQKIKHECYEVRCSAIEVISSISNTVKQSEY